MGQFYTTFGGQNNGERVANTFYPFVTPNTGHINTTDFGYPVYKENHNGQGNGETPLVFNRVGSRVDQEILVKWRTDTVQSGTGTDYQLSINFRGSGNNSSRNAYTANALRGQFQNFERYFSNTSGTLGGGITNGYAANTWYYMRVRATGTTLQRKMWQAGTGEPGWQETIGDGNLGSGWIGAGAWCQVGTRWFEMMSFGWDGDSAPDTMPAAYLAAATPTEISGDSDLTASGVIPKMGTMANDGNSDLTATGVKVVLGSANIVGGGSTLTTTIGGEVNLLSQPTYDTPGFLSLDYTPGDKDDVYHWLGQSFTLPGFGFYNIPSMEFVFAGAVAAASVQLRVYNNASEADASFPPIASKTISVTGPGSVPAWSKFTFDTPITTLAGGNSYFVTLVPATNNSLPTYRSTSNPYAGGTLYQKNTDGDFTWTSKPGSDLAFKVNYTANIVGGAADLDSDSNLVASGVGAVFGSASWDANSDFAATGTRNVVGTMVNDGNSDFTASAQRIALGTSAMDGNSDFYALGFAGIFASLGVDSDSTLTAVGSLRYDGTAVWDANSDITAVGLRIPLGQALLSGDSDMQVDSTGIEITHLTITKSYVYKIYDQNWNYLGVWDDVVSDFGYSQEINSAGSQINVKLARNSDSLVQNYDVLSTDDDEAILTDGNETIAAETETTNAIGPGTTVDLNLNVKIYEFSTDPTQPIEGELVFTGYISMYTSRYGNDENTDVSIFSYGSDLDNWLLSDSGGNTRVAYLSKDPSNMLRDSLDKFQAAGGLISYSNGVPGATETINNLISNPSFETNSTGWTLSLGYGGRTTSGGVQGSAYYYIQNGGGSSLDYTSPNLVSGQPYRFSLYMKRPATGQVNVTGAHNSVIVFDLNVSPPNAWTRYDISFTATANTPLNLSIGIVGSDNVVYIDGVSLTKGSDLLEYFDGSTVSTDPKITYSWAGTAHASQSIRTRVISNVGATIDDTNTLRSYTFNVNSELEVIKKGLELAPTDWYFYTDLATNMLHYHGRPTTPAHYFYLGKHVLGLDLEQTIEGITNDVVFTGGKPTNLTLDRFNDVAGTDLQNHVGELGATWVKRADSTSTAAIKVSNANRIYPTGAGEGMFMTTTDYGSSDYEIEIDYYIASVQGDFSVMGRLDPTASTHYLARILGTSIVELYKRINGTYTLLQQQSLPAGKTLQVGQTRNFKFKMEGAQLTITVDGTAYIDMEDRSIIYGTRAGLRTAADYNHTNTTGMHVDNFQVRLLDKDDAKQVYKRYTDPASILAYRRGLERVQDNRVTLEASADAIIGSLINRNKTPRYRSNITIAAGTYPIRTIKLGQLVAFRNFGNFIDEIVMQVVRLDYTADAVALQLDTLLPSVPKRLEDIKRNLAQAEVEDNPDAPTT